MRELVRAIDIHVDLVNLEVTRNLNAGMANTGLLRTFKLNYLPLIILSEMRQCKLPRTSPSLSLPT